MSDSDPPNQEDSDGEDAPKEVEHLLCHYIAVPPIFQTLYDGPFTQCMVCNRDLTTDGTQYMIERSFVGTEPIYEYALCFDCQQQMSEELSKDSLQRIQAHVTERVDFHDRRQQLVQKSTKNIEPWIDECILTKTRREDNQSYTIYAHCDGTDLLFSYLPYMISGTAMEGLARLLSKKTRDRLDGFTEQFLGPGPEVSKEPNSPVFFGL